MQIPFNSIGLQSLLSFYNPKWTVSFVSTLFPNLILCKGKISLGGDTQNSDEKINAWVSFTSCLSTTSPCIQKHPDISFCNPRKPAPSFPYLVMFLCIRIISSLPCFDFWSTQVCPMKIKKLPNSIKFCKIKYYALM